MRRVTIQAEPEPITIDPGRTALIVIDMQRDFLEPGGFGEALGNDVSLLNAAVAPSAVLCRARAGHAHHPHPRRPRPDLPTPRRQGRARRARMRIGAPGPMGRILIRGEPGHDIIPELYPLAGEPVIDKPGKGAFYATDLELMLQQPRHRTLIVCGVTTEVCVHTTVREANDRGYRCIVPADCCASYFPEFHEAGLEMIKAQGGIFGWVSRFGTHPFRLAPASRCRRRLIRGARPERACAGPGIGHAISIHDFFNARRTHDQRRFPRTRSSRICGRPATGTPSSASAPTSWSICWR